MSRKRAAAHHRRRAKEAEAKITAAGAWYNGAVRVLGINTATSITELALLENGRKIFARSWKSRHEEAEKIFPVLRETLKKLGAKKLEKIFVVSGPGAFTGLRIGVTIANALAFTEKASIISCNTFDYFRVKIPDRYKKQTAIALRAGGDYAALLAPHSKEPKRISSSQAINYLKNKKIKFLVGDLNAEEKKKISLPQHCRWLPDKSLATFSDALLQIIAKKLPQHKIVKPYYLLPPKITKSKKTVFV